jgi:hypothetical protein
MKSDVRETEVCCYCLKDTRSGIYDRKDPDLVPCHGHTPVHAGDE